MSSPLQSLPKPTKPLRQCLPTPSKRKIVSHERLSASHVRKSEKQRRTHDIDDKEETATPPPPVQLGVHQDDGHGTPTPKEPSLKLTLTKREDGNFTVIDPSAPKPVEALVAVGVETVRCDVPNGIGQSINVVPPLEGPISAISYADQSEEQHALAGNPHNSPLSANPAA